tara:strand:+ start:39 stop:701 length:663 start_codon:yes stop_codon:yes gene_type:complete
MPCTKCEEGNYKWGETGECKYDTLQDCESANSKYNKMQPTPLGKKSYEEYAKELKEYNLSSQRFDFKNIKILDKLLKEADKASAKFKKLKDKAIDAELAWEDEVELTKKGKIGYDESLDNIIEVKKQNEKRLEAAAKLSKPAYLKYSDSAKKAEKLQAKFEKDRQIVLGEKGEIQSLLLDFRANVTDFEQAAKSLGVDVNVEKYKSEIRRLDAAQLMYKG